ncbi:hypothetical protein [Hydrogenophaga sp.]|uniref:hypothetical protein n=1 Tax=Hydrogenophaga sp. TaxID=1904254 RepID=UPI00356541A7
MFRRLDAQRLVALFAAGMALFNFPLLAIWDHDVLILGLPLFPAVLFAIWALLIAALAWVVERHAGPAMEVDRGDGDGRPG